MKNIILSILIGISLTACGEQGVTAVEASSSPAQDITFDAWKSFGGPTGLFIVDYLPETLPEEPEKLWEIPIKGQSYAPISADQEIVIVPDHGSGNDYFYVMDIKTGKELWHHSIPNDKDMDFGASPRVQPMIKDGKIFILNAWGVLQALDKQTGDVIWEKDISMEYDATIPVWGYCSSMHFVDKGIVVNPGGTSGGLVCLNLEDGSTVWTSESDEANYASYLHTTIHGVEQLITYDMTSLFSVDPNTGENLWRVEVWASSGYICPTPVKTEKGLLLIDQDNGLRLLPMKDGKPVEEEMLMSGNVFSELATPIIIGDKAYIYYYGIICVNKDTLETEWEYYENDAIASASFGYFFVEPKTKRVLLYTADGTLSLIDLSGEELKVLSQVKITEFGEIVPALIDGVIYARDNESGAYAYKLWDEPETAE